MPEAIPTRKSLGRDFASTAVVQIGVMLCSFVVLALISRRCDAVGVGEYGLFDSQVMSAQYADAYRRPAGA